MSQHITDYAPFFREGRLFLPRQTVDLLLNAGLDSAVADAAASGLALDDDHEQIGIISQTLVKALGQLVLENPQAFAELNSDEAQFMLTNRSKPLGKH